MNRTCSWQQVSVDVNVKSTQVGFRCPHMFLFIQISVGRRAKVCYVSTEFRMLNPGFSWSLSLCGTVGLLYVLLLNNKRTMIKAFQKIILLNTSWTTDPEAWVQREEVCDCLVDFIFLRSLRHCLLLSSVYMCS